MDSQYRFTGDDAARTVYIRKVSTETLPQEIRSQIPGINAMYSVHDTDGERLALVRHRELAFVLARQNELTPVSVH